MSEAGVTVVKKIAEFRWKCPKCGYEECCYMCKAVRA